MLNKPSEGDVINTKRYFVKEQVCYLVLVINFPTHGKVMKKSQELLLMINGAMTLVVIQKLFKVELVKMMLLLKSLPSSRGDFILNLLSMAKDIE